MADRLKLSAIMYSIGKMMFKLLFHGPKWFCMIPWWLPKDRSNWNSKVFFGKKIVVFGAHGSAFFEKVKFLQEKALDISRKNKIWTQIDGLGGDFVKDVVEFSPRSLKRWCNLMDHFYYLVTEGTKEAS